MSRQDYRTQISAPSYRHLGGGQFVDSGILGEEEYSSIDSWYIREPSSQQPHKILTRNDVELIATEVINYLQSDTAETIRSRLVQKVADIIQRPR